MASWLLVPSLVSLRSEFNLLAPSRDKASDGSIGDTAHAEGGNSDHLPDEDFAALRANDPDNKNELHAIDVDKDLRQAGLTMDRCVQVIVTRHRAGLDDRLQYVIWNRKIWSRSWGWTGRAYTGASPHDHHAHFSVRYTDAAESSTRPWGLLDLMEDDMDKAELKAGLTEWAKSPEGRQALAVAVLNTDGVVPAPGAPKPGKDANGKEINTHWAAASYLQNVYATAVSARTYAAGANTNAAKAAGKDFDEKAVISGVLAGLDPALIAAAIPAELAQQVATELATRLAA